MIEFLRDDNGGDRDAQSGVDRVSAMLAAAVCHHGARQALLAAAARLIADTDITSIPHDDRY